MWVKTESEIWAKADAAAVALMMKPGREDRRLAAIDRTVASAQKMTSTLRRRCAKRSEQEKSRHDHQVEMEFGGSWGSQIHIRAQVPRQKPDSENRDQRSFLSANPRRPLLTYSMPLEDRRGRVALYFSVTYIGLKSKKWRPGKSADHVRYILRPDSLDQADEGQQILSNMGSSIGEIAACWRAIETIEQAYRSNAIVQHRIILNLPHHLQPGQRRALVEDFCERTFGRLSLPYVAAIHRPSKRGDQRNYHVHICFSTRPFTAVDECEWKFAMEKVNGLTDADGLRRMRCLAAAHMNTACRAAGVDVRFTHQSYAQRNIRARRQDHVGPERMAAHDRGETVAIIERNAVIVKRNEASYARDTAEQMKAMLDAEIALLQRRLHWFSIRKTIARGRASIEAIAKASAELAGRPTAAITVVSDAKEIAKRSLSIARRMEARPKSAAVFPAHIAAVAASAASISVSLEQRSCRQTALGSVAGKRDDLQSGGPAAIAARTSAISASQRENIERRASLKFVQDELGRLQDSMAAASEQREAALSLATDASATPDRLDGAAVAIGLSNVQRGDDPLIRVLDESEAERPRRIVAEADARAAVEKKRCDEEREKEQREEIKIASRILLEAPAKPYRYSGKVPHPQLNGLVEEEREIVRAAGLTHPDVLAALRERARRDRDNEAFESMLKAIVNDRIFIKIDGDRRLIDDATSRRFPVSDDFIYSAASQAELKRLSDRQLDELRPVINHVSVSPSHVIETGSALTFSDRAPANIRATAETWKHSDHFSGALRAAWEAAVRNHKTIEAENRSLLAAACDLIESAPEPYLKVGGRIIANLDALSKIDRETVEAVDLDSPEVRAALENRAAKDERAFAAMLKEVHDKRIFVLRKDDHFTVEADIRRPFAVPSSMIESKSGQAGLEAIFYKHIVERQAVARFAKQHPGYVVKDGEHWALSGRVPADLRKAAKAWRHSQQLQKILANAASSYATDPSNYPSVDSTADASPSIRKPGGGDANKESAETPAAQPNVKPADGVDISKAPDPLARGARIRPWFLGPGGIER